jgi:serine phosphatase RsbU (regulator of sigma subunit)
VNTPQIVRVESHDDELAEVDGVDDSDAHPAIAQQLRRLGVTDVNAPPDAQTWNRMLAWMADQIDRMAGERRRLRLSIDVESELCDLVASERRARQALETALDDAGEVQRSFVPPATTIERPFLQLAAAFEPAASCGGDWWSVYPLPGDRTMIAIADVTGHGVAPAMLTGVARGACDMIVRATDPDRLTCAGVLAELNRVVCETGTDRLRMTCSVSIVDPRRGAMRFATAGHTLPYVVRRQPTKKQLLQVVGTGTTLGDAPEATFNEASVRLHSDDLLLWYTDGILACENDRGEEFGEKRLRQLLRGLDVAPPAALRDQLWSALERHRGARAPADDIAFVFARTGAI